MRTLLLTLAAAALLPLGTARGQTPDAPGSAASGTDDAGFRRFSITVAASVSLGGPSAELRDLFVARGFDDAETLPCLIFCLPAQERPDVVGDEGYLLFSARYRFDRRWSAALLHDRGQESPLVRGFRDPAYGLQLSPRVSSFALTAGYRVLSVVDLSAGPALYRVSLDRVGSGRLETEDASTLGLLLDGGLELPSDSRFFVRIFGQYRWLPAREFGPMSVSGGPFDTVPSLTFEAFDLGASQLVFGVGGGVRL